jgi:hypothetical protein
MARVSSINLPATPSGSGGAELCPLCGGPNDCQLCTSAAYKGPCWCEAVNFPQEFLARVPAGAERACVCRACVASFHRQQSAIKPLRLLPGDFYFEAGMMVFTESYHRRRGYCCANECRHCPYREAGA